MRTRNSLLAAALFCLGGQAFADVDVEGFLFYEDKAFTYGGWTGADPGLPIPRANVQILNLGGTVIASGATNLDGSFSISTPTLASPRDIQVRVMASTSNSPGFQALTVTNTVGGIYNSVGPAVYTIDNTMTSFDTGTITVLKTVLGTGEEGSPFNMFDMGVRAWEYITGPCGRGNVALVNIRWPFSGSFASGSTATIDFGDGYDDSVILHEVGHVMHNLYSDSDSPGGTHFFGDSDQDPRLSLGEGFATFFMGAVMDDLGREALYMDLNPFVQTGGIQIRLKLESTDPLANDAFGSADESSVACSLYDIIDTESSVDDSPGTDDDFLRAASLIGTRTVHEAWFDMFEGPAATAANLMLVDFWDGWFSVHGTDGKHIAMLHLFELHHVRFDNDVDEPNETSGSAVPVFGFDSFSSSRTLYSSTNTPPTPGGGDEDWYSMDLVAGSRVALSTRYPNAANDADTMCDTHLTFFDSSLNQLASNEDSGTGRNAAIPGTQVANTGTYFFRVQSTDSLRDVGIYEYEARYIFQNFLPNVGQPSAAPASVNIFRRETTLQVAAGDSQPLTFTWTPTNGGTIVGSGNTVIFRAPPGDHGDTIFSIDLDVEDTFGAAAPTVNVKVPFARKFAVGEL